MRRRDFITLLGGTIATWPLTARAQTMRRIGVLMGFAENDREGQGFAAAFRGGLQQVGWADGHNIRIDTRWATPGGDAPSRQRLAQELVALRPDVILSATTSTTSALLQQTRTVPIVFATVADPISSNFVASFPRPGGNGPRARPKVCRL